MSSDDLGPLLVPPPFDRGLRYGQGRLLTWNTDTFENQVEWLGVTLTNLPVITGVDALTFQPGDLVSLLGWAPGGGAGSWWILGKVIIPGTDAAEQAIAFLRSRVAAQIARNVIAETMHTAQVFGIGERNSTSYGDLTFIDEGPIIADVQISEAGKAVVAVSCQMTAHISAGRQGFMSAEVTGATSLPPDDNRAFVVGVAGDPTLSVDPTGQATEFAILEGLNPGPHTFQAKYRTITTDGPVQFTNPEMVVWAF